MLNSPQITIEHAKNGMWTAVAACANGKSIYLHSRYSPYEEAERFVMAQLNGLGSEKIDRLVIYGVGCGHHIRAFLKHTEKTGICLEIWESNVVLFQKLVQSGVITDLLAEPRVMLVITNDMRQFQKRMAIWSEMRIHVVVHEPSLHVMPPELAQFRVGLQDYKIKQGTAIAFRELLNHNFEENTKEKWPSVSRFRGLPVVPVILISAGPSLAKSINLLAAASKYCFLGAVGTAASMVANQGIKLDFVVMTDPQQNMVDQLNGWDTSTVPLFFLSTMCPHVVRQYRGPRFILYQDGYAPAEEQASRRGEPLVKTGGSVATTMFSLARMLGFHPLCLVGQDLAYTENRTHVEGTSFSQKLHEPDIIGERVMSFDQKSSVVTARNLLLYKKWFEEQARSSQELFYNATEGGAYIEGFSHITLQEFLDMIKGVNVTTERKKFNERAYASSTN